MLIEDIKEAELVLVGIGSEMQVKLQALKEISNFRDKLRMLENDPEREWLIPFLIRYYLKEEFHPEIMSAYKKLRKLLEGKNYFIVSLSTDDLIKNSGFEADRIVLPCGTYDTLQCADNCSGRLFPIEDDLWGDICGWIEDREVQGNLEKAKCPDCGAALVMNQYGEPAYHEGGYINNWERYTKWLQGTVNRRLCILELGVGMEFPSVIRWPFEKICYYNQKAVFWRVHSSLYQLSEEIKDRGKSVKKDPLVFLNEQDLDSLEE